MAIELSFKRCYMILWALGVPSVGGGVGRGEGNAATITHVAVDLTLLSDSRLSKIDAFQADRWTTPATGGSHWNGACYTRFSRAFIDRFMSSDQSGSDRIRSDFLFAKTRSTSGVITSVILRPGMR